MFSIRGTSKRRRPTVFALFDDDEKKVDKQYFVEKLSEFFSFDNETFGEIFEEIASMCGSADETITSPQLKEWWV